MAGRLTSCLSGFSQARARGRRGGRLSRGAEPPDAEMHVSSSCGTFSRSLSPREGALRRVNTQLELCTRFSDPHTDGLPRWGGRWRPIRGLSSDPHGDQSPDADVICSSRGRRKRQMLLDATPRASFCILPSYFPIARLAAAVPPPQPPDRCE